MPETRVLTIDETAVVARLAELWDVADRPPVWPAYDSDVLALTEAGGYLMDRRDLERFIGDGTVPHPPQQGGVNRWPPALVGILFARLENMRRWRPDSPLHAAKLTAVEWEFHKAKRQGSEPFPDLDQHSVELLLSYLAQTADFGQRVALFLALREKLARLGAL